MSLNAHHHAANQHAAGWNAALQHATQAIEAVRAQLPSMAGPGDADHALRALQHRLNVARAVPSTQREEPASLEGTP